MNLTGVQLEQELDSEVVEMAAVLNDLDERRQPTLAWRQRGDGDGAVELANHWDGSRKEHTSCVRHLCCRKPDSNKITSLVMANMCCAFVHPGNWAQILWPCQHVSELTADCTASSFVICGKITLKYRAVTSMTGSRVCSKQKKKKKNLNLVGM